MDGIEVHGEGRAAAGPGKRTRRVWTAQEKRRILRESQRSGAVRGDVARRHGVHVSVLNRWRSEQLSRAAVTKKAVRRVQLLPVQVRKSQPSRVAGRPTPATIGGTTVGAMEVVFPAGQRLAVRGVVDRAALCTVLQELSRC
jgi:transposase